jgi:DNA-directed RNA polymerase beta' subunit
MKKKLKKSFSYYLVYKSKFPRKRKNIEWKFFFIKNSSLIGPENRRKSSLYQTGQKIIPHKIKRISRNSFQLKELYQTEVKKVQLSVLSPMKIRSLCLRQSTEGFLIGRIWNARTVKYKTLRPIPGGLFCERAFGSSQRGICSCKRSQWRIYPKFPKKLRRLEICYCLNCSSQTIYHTKNQNLDKLKFSFYWKFFSFFEKSNSLKVRFFSPSSRKFYKKGIDIVQFSLLFNQRQIKKIRLNEIICKCGKIKLSINWFFSVFRVCRFCLSSTRFPFYGKITTYWFSKSKENFNLNNDRQEDEKFTLIDLVSSEYQPGFCTCGRTSTEVSWEDTVFCGCCGNEISIELLPRRYTLGYLPLSIPVAHFWYYYYEPRPLPRLTNFSRRLFIMLLHCERVVAEHAFIILNTKNQSYFSSEFWPKKHFTNFFPNYKSNFSGLEKFPTSKISSGRKKLALKTKKYYSNVVDLRNQKTESFIFPWYCLYRDTPFLQDFKRGKRESLEILNKILIRFPKNTDYLFRIYKKLSFCQNRDKTYTMKEKLGAEFQISGLFLYPKRTGGELIFNRLQILNRKDWCFQAYQRLKSLRKEIEIVERESSQTINKKFIYYSIIKVRHKILLRIRIMVELNRSQIDLHWLILQSIPVLPPDLRPILSLGNEKIIVADINILYQRVIERNIRVAQRRRLTRFYKNHYKRDLYYHERLLQESLSCLFENNIKEKRGRKDSKKRLYKSLAEVLKGKRGRFRNNLLGKRVNYSGRSVIVSGPELALHQCGLPREIILILFQPFLIRFLVGRVQNGKKIQTRFQARQFIEEQTNYRWGRRKEVLAGFPVLLNRAPTLHRFGFQAFQPQLISQRVIQLHPLSCSGFNADFDGDQIAVHVPLSPHARSEAWRLIIPGSHFFSPATSDLIFRPSQDIILGTYYLTTRRAFFSIFRSFHHLPGFVKNKKLINIKKKWKAPIFFFKKEEIVTIFEKGSLGLEQFVWIYVKKIIVDYEDEIFIYERRLNKTGIEQKSSLWHWETNTSVNILIRRIVGRIIFSYIFF